MRIASLAPLIALVAMMAEPSLAQSSDPWPETDFLRVSIDGALNLRAGPTTDAERVRRLPDGTLLRRIACQAGPDEDWCEVETLKGDFEGWAAVRFLRPWFGADPAALESPAVAPDERLTAEAPGRFAGRIERGGVVDLLLTIPTDRQLTIAVDTPDGIGTALFSADGSRIDANRGAAEYSVILLQGSEILVRIADMTGESGDWSLDVGLD